MNKTFFFITFLCFLPHCGKNNIIGMVNQSNFVREILGIDEELFNKNNEALINGLSFSKNNSNDPFLKNNTPQKIVFINTGLMQAS